MKHWAENYIGIKRTFGGDSPEEGFDCWGLFKYLQKRYYNIDAPEIDTSACEDIKVKLSEFSKANEYMKEWIEVEKPNDGDCSVMTSKNNPSHVGIWLEINNQRGIIHCADAQGVVFQNLNSLRASGWKIVRYYRHKSRA